MRLYSLRLEKRIGPSVRSQELPPLHDKTAISLKCEGRSQPEADLPPVQADKGSVIRIETFRPRLECPRSAEFRIKQPVTASPTLPHAGSEPCCGGDLVRNALPHLATDKTSRGLWKP